MNRRHQLTAIGLSPLAAVPAVVMAMETPEQRVNRAMNELQAALTAMHGGRWKQALDHENKLVAMIPL